MTNHLQLHQLKPQVQQCIQNCLDCHSVCLNTVTYCLQHRGDRTDAVHVRLLLYCAEICKTSVNFMLQGSHLSTRVCGVCAEICDRSYVNCEQFAEDTQIQSCAEVCHRCAQSCRNLMNISL